MLVPTYRCATTAPPSDADYNIHRPRSSVISLFLSLSLCLYFSECPSHWTNICCANDRASTSLKRLRYTDNILLSSTAPRPGSRRACGPTNVSQRATQRRPHHAAFGSALKHKPKPLSVGLGVVIINPSLPSSDPEDLLHRLLGSLGARAILSTCYQPTYRSSTDPPPGWPLPVPANRKVPDFAISSPG